MITIHLLNKNASKEENKRFTKDFESPYQASNYIRKCRYGNKLEVISVDTDTYEEYNACRGALYGRLK